MNRIKLNILSPWPVLIVLVMFVSFISVVALAKDDKVVGYTDHGIPVLESELDDKLQVDRLLDIQVTLQKGLKVNVLNESSLELYYNESDVYTIVLNCLDRSGAKAGLTNIDFFHWVTVGSIRTGDKVAVTRNPVKNIGNPKLQDSELLEQRIKNWDYMPRVCDVVGIQKN